MLLIQAYRHINYSYLYVDIDNYTYLINVANYVTSYIFMYCTEISLDHAYSYSYLAIS